MSVDSHQRSLVYREPVCFLCDQDNKAASLHAVTTLGVDYKVRECASILGDVMLLAKLSDSDLVAKEAKYHTNCLLYLYNRRRSHEKSLFDTDRSSAESEFVHGIVFAQLISYIEECRLDPAVVPIFKLADLAKLYADRLLQLGINY